LYQPCQHQGKPQQGRIQQPRLHDVGWFGPAQAQGFQDFNEDQGTPP